MLSKIKFFIKISSKNWPDCSIFSLETMIFRNPFGPNFWLILKFFPKIAFLWKNFKFEMTFKIQYQKQRILTLNRPQIKLWKSNILFVILLILTIQKPSLGCVLGYIGLSLPVFCGRDFHPTRFNSVKNNLIPVDLKCRFGCISKKVPKRVSG